MKTFRGFELKRDVGLGLQNHYERKNTQEPARFSKWGGFKDLDWDFLDKEFYAKDGKNLTEDQDDIEEEIKPNDMNAKKSAKVAPMIFDEEPQIKKTNKNQLSTFLVGISDSIDGRSPPPPYTTRPSSMNEVYNSEPNSHKYQ